jgi:coupling of ubiquitin conjugation to ER degradation protein 1
LLQKRRDEMILAARRKMEAKVAAEAGQGKTVDGVGSG